MRTPVRIIRRRALDGTIDGHDPILVTFRIKAAWGWFRLTVYSVNLGRGYSPGEFLANVKRLRNSVGEREYVAILFQEIDEADLSPEHKIIRDVLTREFGDEVQFVQWATREPIVVIGAGIKVTHSRKAMTMDQGTAIGAPEGTGPRRFLTYCRLVIEGVTVGVANQHPHRYSLRGNRAVATALTRGERVTRRVIGALVRECDLVIDGGDLNTPRYPLSHPDQRVAYRRGLDYIRFVSCASTDHGDPS